jgi:hypothetical protein
MFNHYTEGIWGLQEGFCKNFAWQKGEIIAKIVFWYKEQVREYDKMKVG